MWRELFKGVIQQNKKVHVHTHRNKKKNMQKVEFLIKISFILGEKMWRLHDFYVYVKINEQVE